MTGTALTRERLVEIRQEIRERSDAGAFLDAVDGTVFALIDELERHRDRQDELLAANSQEVDRRRKAEAALSMGQGARLMPERPTVEMIAAIPENVASLDGIAVYLAMRQVAPALPDPDQVVHIWSEEHGAYWRPNGCGYTQFADRAGVFTLADAKARTAHCGPEKQIEFRPALVSVERFAAPGPQAGVDGTSGGAGPTSAPGVFCGGSRG